jgi:putative transposase
MSHRKTAQLMRGSGVWVRYKKKYKATTNSDHKKPIYDNELKQNFIAQKPEQGGGAGYHLRFLKLTHAKA